MKNFDFFDEDDFSADGEMFLSPLDTRFVVTGILMLVSSIIIPAITENASVRIFCGLMFSASFFVMTKYEKQEPLP